MAQHSVVFPFPHFKEWAGQAEITSGERSFQKPRQLPSTKKSNAYPQAFILYISVPCGLRRVPNLKSVSRLVEIRLSQGRLLKDDDRYKPGIEQGREGDSLILNHTQTVCS